MRTPHEAQAAVAAEINHLGDMPSVDTSFIFEDAEYYCVPFKMDPGVECVDYPLYFVRKVDGEVIAEPYNPFLPLSHRLEQMVRVQIS